MSLQKRAPRYSISDWFTRSYANWTNSEKTRLEAEKVRDESKSLRVDIDNRTRWDQMDTNCRLSDRIDRVRIIKASLELRVDKLNKELELLNESKDNTEKIQTWFYYTSQVNTENLVWREGRREIDLVVDDVEEELHKERVMLDTVRSKLQNKISESFEQMNLLKETRKSLLGGLQKKNEALDIDVVQYNTTEESSNISLKPNPTRVPENMITLEQWEDVCAMMISSGDTALDESIKMRETVHRVIHSIQNDVYSQNLAVLFALRRRIHELMMAVDEDKYQKKLLEEEASKLEDEIRCIVLDIDRRTQSLKLAHTRLENRLSRTQEDLCRDSVQYGLEDEIRQINTSLSASTRQKSQAQHSLHCIEKQIHRLNSDIEKKNLSIRIDQQCIESRQKFEKPKTFSSNIRENALVSGDRSTTVLKAY